MLHDAHDDPEMARAFQALREQLGRARSRVAEMYPGARIRWAVHIARWLIVDPERGVTIEASESLDQLATGHGRSSQQPPSGVHRKPGDR
jgi:hypothetical protein